MNLLLGTNDVPAPLKTMSCNAAVRLGKLGHQAEALSGSR